MTLINRLKQDYGGDGSDSGDSDETCDFCNAEIPEEEPYYIIEITLDTLDSNYTEIIDYDYEIINISCKRKTCKEQYIKYLDYFGFESKLPHSKVTIDRIKNGVRWHPEMIFVSSNGMEGEDPTAPKESNDQIYCEFCKRTRPHIYTIQAQYVVFEQEAITIFDGIVLTNFDTRCVNGFLDRSVLLGLKLSDKDNLLDLIVQLSRDLIAQLVEKVKDSADQL